MIEPTVRTVTLSSQERRIALIAAAAIDALAAAILLGATSLPSPLAGIAAAALHGAAILLSLVPFGGGAGRRWLCFACVLTVPVVGIAIAAAGLTTPGRGPAFAWRRMRARRRRAPVRATLEHLGSALSPCDALGGGDDEQRRSALYELSRRSDPGAIAVLRWATAGRDPDLALSAALVLDGIRERAERRAAWIGPTEARRAAR
jgi:hypothetical protein